MKLPRLDQLCPYCAAWPSLPCAEAETGLFHFYGRVHLGDPEFVPLLAVTFMVEGLREWAGLLAGNVASGRLGPVAPSHPS